MKTGTCHNVNRNLAEQIWISVCKLLRANCQYIKIPSCKVVRKRTSDLIVITPGTFSNKSFMKRQRSQQSVQTGSFHEAIVTATSKLHVESPICSEQTSNQITNIASQCCNVACKRTSSLTVNWHWSGRRLHQSPSVDWNRPCPIPVQPVCMLFQNFIFNPFSVPL